MERSTLDMWVGLFMVAGLGALVILALKVGNMSSIGGEETYTLVAEFTNIGGLKPRAAVKSAGVVVGRVGAISFDDKKFVARVTMAIDARYKFPTDTSASIMTAGLLGEQYVGFEAGAEEKELAPGATVKLTQSAMVLEKMISKFFYDKAAEGGGAAK